MTMLTEVIDAVIGIDTHRDSHEVEIADPAGKPIVTMRIGNDSAGFTRLLAAIAKVVPGPRVAVCIEGSRGYGIGRARALAASGDSNRITQPAHGHTATTDRSEVQVTLQPGQPQDHPFGPPVPAAARKLTVTDNGGTTATAEFFGEQRRGDPAWRGQYEVHPQLAPDTAWIELLGQHIELTGEPAGVQVWTEPLPAQSGSALLDLRHRIEPDYLRTYSP
jgi:hypothetical protein